jgi:hypothetical protein
MFADVWAQRKTEGVSNFITRVWNGEYGLARQFWLIHLIPVLILQAPCRLHQPAWLPSVMFVPIYIVTARGVWRAARVNPSVWGKLAIAVVALEVVIPLLAFIAFCLLFAFALSGAK